VQPLRCTREAALFENHLEHAQQVEIDAMEIDHVYVPPKIDRFDRYLSGT
jgi:hypothetical protein